jgi:DNA-binding MarR family transcriptional regulator
VAAKDPGVRAVAGCIALRARRFSRVVNRHYEHAMRGAGLTPSQFTLLAAVAIMEPVPPIALARTLDLDKSTMSRNLRPLIQSKFLVCEVGNAGGQTVRITRIGRSVLRRALPAWKKAQVEVMALLGPDVGSRLDEMIAATAKR